MKQFEVGKTYKVSPYSYTKDGRRDYKHPETITIISRTDTYIRTEFSWGTCKSNRSFRISKRMTDAEQVNYCDKIITANDEA